MIKKVYEKYQLQQLVNTAEARSNIIKCQNEMKQKKSLFKKGDYTTISNWTKRNWKRMSALLYWFLCFKVAFSKYYHPEAYSTTTVSTIETDVIHIIKWWSKVPGPDANIWEVYKTNIETLAKLLIKLINDWFDAGHIPKQWKTSKWSYSSKKETQKA